MYSQDGSFVVCSYIVFLIISGLRSRCGHYILQLWFLLLLSSSFFIADSQRLQSGCLPYFYIWCGLSACLECMFEMCCTRLAENIRRKKSQKIAICAPSHIFVGGGLLGYIFTAKAYIDNWKKLLSSNISSICLHNMVNFGPLTAEIGSVIWGTPANFNEFAS